MVKVAVPVFLMIKAWETFVPTTTFEKLMAVGLSWITGKLTVSVAALLVTVPALLLTVTSNVEPLSEVVVIAEVYVAEVAPEMFAPFFCH